MRFSLLLILLSLTLLVSCDVIDPESEHSSTVLIDDPTDIEGNSASDTTDDIFELSAQQAQEIVKFEWNLFSSIEAHTIVAQYAGKDSIWGESFVPYYPHRLTDTLTYGSHLFRVGYVADSLTPNDTLWSTPFPITVSENSYFFSLTGSDRLVALQSVQSYTLQFRANRGEWQTALKGTYPKHFLYGEERDLEVRVMDVQNNWDTLSQTYVIDTFYSTAQVYYRDGNDFSCEYNMFGTKLTADYNYDFLSYNSPAARAFQLHEGGEWKIERSIDSGSSWELIHRYDLDGKTASDLSDSSVISRTPGGIYHIRTTLSSDSAGTYQNIDTIDASSVGLIYVDTSLVLKFSHMDVEYVDGIDVYIDSMGEWLHQKSGHESDLPYSLKIENSSLDGHFGVARLAGNQKAYALYHLNDGRVYSSDTISFYAPIFNASYNYTFTTNFEGVQVQLNSSSNASNGKDLDSLYIVISRSTDELSFNPIDTVLMTLDGKFTAEYYYDTLAESGTYYYQLQSYKNIPADEDYPDNLAGQQWMGAKYFSPAIEYNGSPDRPNRIKRIEPNGDFTIFCLPQILNEGVVTELWGWLNGDSLKLAETEVSSDTITLTDLDDGNWEFAIRTVAGDNASEYSDRISAPLPVSDSLGWPSYYGATWTAGNGKTISWNTSLITTASVQVDLYVDGEFRNTMGKNLFTDGSVTVTVPMFADAGDNYQIHIVSGSTELVGLPFKVYESNL